VLIHLARDRRAARHSHTRGTHTYQPVPTTGASPTPPSCSRDRTPPTDCTRTRYKHSSLRFGARYTPYTLHEPKPEPVSTNYSVLTLVTSSGKSVTLRPGSLPPLTSHNLASVTPVASVSPSFGDDHHDNEWFQRPTSWLRSVVLAIKRMRQELWPVHHCPRKRSPPPNGGGMCRPALLVSHHERVRHLLLPRAHRRFYPARRISLPMALPKDANRLRPVSPSLPSCVSTVKLVARRLTHWHTTCLHLRPEYRADA
jgi:hypothetical protein